MSDWHSINFAPQGRVDIPGATTFKIKTQIHMTATRCLVCGKLEAPEFNKELYDPIIIGETSGICESCRKAIEWAKERMKVGEVCERFKRFNTNRNIRDCCKRTGSIRTTD